MKVTRGQIITRGLTQRCPNCGGRSLFREGKLFELRDNCGGCGMKFEKDEGFFLGAMSLNYAVTLGAVLLPVLLLWYYGAVTGRWAAGLALAGALVGPLAFYRSSRCWQLMLYYAFLPQHLPANRRKLTGDEDENV